MCGIVGETSAEESKFVKGHVVVSRFDEPMPVGGVAEYRIVKADCLE